MVCARETGSLDKLHTRSTTLSFRKPQRQQTPLEIRVDGTSHAGKSIWTLITTLANAQGKRVFLVDCDMGSVSLNPDCHGLCTAAPADDWHGSGGDYGLSDAKLDVARARAHGFPFQSLAFVDYAVGVHLAERAKRECRDPGSFRQRAERARKVLLGWTKAAVTVAPAACVVVAA